MNSWKGFILKDAVKNSYSDRSNARRLHGEMNVLHALLDPCDGIEIPKGLCALAVMTKAPRTGQVKTRLTPPLTPEEAAMLNICFLRDTAASISRAATKGNARGIAVYTPVGAEEDYIKILPPEFQLVPQRGEALGERVICATEDLFRLGFASVCLINSDSPTLPQQVFTEAATVLEKSEDTVVLGPSDDGGYYLVGLNKPQRALFEDIAWSTENVLRTNDRARATNQS